MNYSDAELTASSEKGMAEAKAAMAASAGPIFLKDEGGFDSLEQAYAMGWNAVWASEENHERFQGIQAEGGASHE